MDIPEYVFFLIIIVLKVFFAIHVCKKKNKIQKIPFFYNDFEKLKKHTISLLSNMMMMMTSVSQFFFFIQLWFVLQFWTTRLEKKLLPNLHCTAEGIYFSVFAAYHFSFLVATNDPVGNYVEDDLSFSWSALIGGLVFCTLERFLIGFVFHHLPWYEQQHAEYHKRLVRRKVYQERQHTDDAQEIITYTILFWIMSSFITSSSFWMGVATEHYLGYRLRTIVQYTSNQELENNYQSCLACPQIKCQLMQWYHQFILNCNTYYWLHVLVDGNTCYGFSSPCWDIVMDRNLSFCGWLACLPFPFVGLVTCDLYKNNLHKEQLQRSFRHFELNNRPLIQNEK